MNDHELELEKALAAVTAMDHLRDGMLVGLGSGSTAAYAIREIARRVADGLKVEATATSPASEALAIGLGIPHVSFERVERVDVTIDGIDEIDSSLRAIKGAGGALLREKIVAAASDLVIMIGDSTKAVATLGRRSLPVEVLPFAAGFALRTLRNLGTPLTRRRKHDGAFFLTDQQAYIFDLKFGVIDDPEQLARTLEAIPGVIAHGLFLGQIDVSIIARGHNVVVRCRKDVAAGAGSGDQAKH
ncbi:ribose-5-phosphate isomerase RpiA [Polymorphobacter megasporae]|uniref:ribose-5-phosphate isomerase RpiA n=1 Tax=Glacieibacterium megasporae TaxID=2835787 RepID=UPI001C1DFF0C|nr:ribose-5-phosphate isomerase RpiA [Polymorphobacter megasporae]UAJ10533.1 ribose-5-phosphate isomerase RpiA [Polymorphobacter megasporae]